MSEHDRAHEEARELEGPTPGAQRQLDAMRARMHRAIVAMVIATFAFAIGFALTGWQIHNAFDTLEDERIERIGGQSSINAYFCRKIDQVGDGVASLVAVSLADAPPESSLTRDQRQALHAFVSYLAKQAHPPRCRQVALQLAVLTGADPEDVVITPLHLQPRRR